MNFPKQGNSSKLLSNILKVEDIPIIFPVENPEILYAIVKIVEENPGLYLHYENLANDLKITSKTVSKYISILE